jgi:hypothetical protein
MVSIDLAERIPRSAVSLAAAVVTLAVLTMGCRAAASSDPAPNAESGPTGSETTTVVAEPTSTTGPTPTAERAGSPGIGDVTLNSDFELPGDYERPAVPSDAIAAASIVNYATAPGVDDALASLEAILEPHEIIVSGDFTGCILIAVWAVPRPDRVEISFEMHPAVDCAVAIEYRAFFVIDRTGANATGTWDYSGDGPPVIVEQVSGASS